MYPPRTIRARTRALILCLLPIPLMPGCGSPATETPAEIPAAPQEAAKASFQALSGAKKATPKPAAPK